MSRTDPFHAFVVELFAGLGPVSIRKMFGGAGVYAQGRMFALLADGMIYIKADNALQERLRGHGSAPFIWTPSSGPKSGQAVEMSYWRLPESALDDPDEAADWGRQALKVAAASQTKLVKAKRRPKT